MPRYHSELSSRADQWGAGQCEQTSRIRTRPEIHSRRSLYYLLKYPPNSSPAVVAAEATEPDVTPPPEGDGKGYANAERPRSLEKERIQIAGAFVLCPMVARESDDARAGRR